MIHDPLCPSAKECNCTHIECCACHESVWCQCYLIAKIRADEYQKFISTTNKTWATQADKAKRELAIVRAQRDLIAERSGLPIPKVNGEEYL